jgi:hypothetical protein
VATAAPFFPVGGGESQLPPPLSMDGGGKDLERNSSNVSNRVLDGVEMLCSGFG